jgi:hypothetical protein
MSPQNKIFEYVIEDGKGVLRQKEVVTGMFSSPTTTGNWAIQQNSKKNTGPQITTIINEKQTTTSP